MSTLSLESLKSGTIIECFNRFYLIIDFSPVSPTEKFASFLFKSELSDWYNVKALLDDGQFRVFRLNVKDNFKVIVAASE